MRHRKRDEVIGIMTYVAIIVLTLLFIVPLAIVSCCNGIKNREKKAKIIRRRYR